MNISIVSASSCRELAFAVEIKKQTVRTFAIRHLHPALFSYMQTPHTHAHTHAHEHTQHTHILLQVVQSGARHILEKEKNGLIYMCILFVQ